MTLKQHTVITAGAAAALLPFWNPSQIGWFAAGSILIDIDHYVFYVWRKRTFGIQGMFAYHDGIFATKHKIPYAGVCLFHTIDFFVLIWVLSLFFAPLKYLLAGLLFHFAIDLVHLYRHDYLTGRAFFLIEHFIRRKRHPGYPFC